MLGSAQIMPVWSTSKLTVKGGEPGCYICRVRKGRVWSNMH